MASKKRAQRAVTHWLEPSLECAEHLLLIEIGELLPEALQITEGVVIDEAHQAEQLQEGILQGCGREQQFALTFKRHFERVGDDVGRLIYVSQAVGFVNDYQVPWDGTDVTRPAPGEMVGADDDLRDLKGAEMALSDSHAIGFGLQQAAGEKELLG